MVLPKHPCVCVCVYGTTNSKFISKRIGLAALKRTRDKNPKSMVAGAISPKHISKDEDMGIQQLKYGMDERYGESENEFVSFNCLLRHVVFIQPYYMLRANCRLKIHFSLSLIPKRLYTHTHKIWTASKDTELSYMKVSVTLCNEITYGGMDENAVCAQSM